jgi:hypothetical protein
VLRVKGNQELGNKKRKWELGSPPTSVRGTHPLVPPTILVVHDLSAAGSRGPLGEHAPAWRHMTHPLPCRFELSSCGMYFDRSVLASMSTSTVMEITSSTTNTRFSSHSILQRGASAFSNERAGTSPYMVDRRLTRMNAIRAAEARP